LETVYDKALRNFEHLLVKTRSLIVIDWNHNREIHSIIEKFRDQIPAKP